MRRPSIPLFLAVCAVGAGCAELVGIDEWQGGTGGAGAADAGQLTGGATASGPGAGGAGAEGGAGCGPDASFVADAMNCGACGHACLGVVKCKDSRCESQKLADADSIHVAVDDAWIYFTVLKDAAVRAVPKDGGTERVVASGEDAVWGIVTVPKPPRVCWTHFKDSGTVKCTDANGSAPLDYGAVDGAPHLMAFDGTTLAWTGRQASGGIARADVSQPSMSIEVAGTQTYPYGIACADGAAYWTTSGDPPGAQPTVMRAKLDGGQIATLVTGSGVGEEPEGIATDGTTVYWVSKTGLHGISADGTTDPAVLVPPFDAMSHFHQVVVDGGYVYWTDGNRGVFRLPEGGGDPLELAASPGAEGLVVDEKYVYWANGAEVMRVAK